MDTNNPDQPGRAPGEVWLRAPRTYRDTPPLSRDRIIEAAIAILDDAGEGKLTMRKLAERLEVAPPTLYWHVKTKDDVLDLAVDEIFADVPLPSATAHWVDATRALILDWRATMLHHPWSPALLGRPMLGPNVLARTEFLQATLVRAGFTDAALAAATHGLANFAIGSALTQSTWQRNGDPGLQSAAHAHIRAHADAYPTLAVNDHLDSPDWDDLFRRGLDYMLDGLQGRGEGELGE
jgi:AcrR family transcriptional regulator